MMYTSLINNLKKRNILACYCATFAEAAKLILTQIPVTASVGIGNSQTLKKMQIAEQLRLRGNLVLDKTVPGLSPAEKVEIKRQALLTDYYLTGTNAISEEGHIVNIDHSGNRAAAMIFGPKKVIVVVGKNKIVGNLEQAVSRARNTAAPLNAARAGYNPPCRSVGHCVDCRGDQRVCFNLVVIEGQADPTRMQVILVGEEAGF